jgi:hypothetical protein
MDFNGFCLKVESCTYFHLIPGKTQRLCYGYFSLPSNAIFKALKSMVLTVVTIFRAYESSLMCLYCGGMTAIGGDVETHGERRNGGEGRGGNGGEWSGGRTTTTTTT